MKNRFFAGLLAILMVCMSLPVRASEAVHHSCRGMEPLAVPEGPSQVVLPNTLPSGDDLRRQVAYIYEAARAGAGTSSFKGYCAWYVNWQLYLLGINDEFVGGHGKDEYNNYEHLDESNGGYKITAYPAWAYSLRSALNAISDYGTRDVYNILIGFQVGDGADGALYGHTCFIHGILDGQVYFSESFAATIDGVKRPEGQPIVCSIDTFASYYEWAVLEGVIWFTDGEKGHTCDKHTYLFQSHVHPHHNCWQCSVCGNIWEDTASTNYDAACETCSTPGKPQLGQMEAAYLTHESQVFTWAPVENATKYVLNLYRADASGAYVLDRQLDKVHSGLTLSLPEGYYKAVLLAANERCPVEGGYRSTASDPVYFDVVSAWDCQRYGHVWSQVDTFPPTCMDNGYDTYQCTWCAEISYAQTPATGHSYGPVVEDPAATETTDGLATATCQTCGHTRTQTIPAFHRNPFSDVGESRFYYAPTVWAYEAGITTGTQAGLFTPGWTCTRGQVVTFLWRAMGSPEPVGDDCPFVDVNQNSFYYKALLWALENGITQGVDSTHFRPDAAVTRGQTVTFLHRAMGKPDSGTSYGFSDLVEGSFYYDAVLWAWQNEIASGVRAARFEPGSPCTRGQVVTFLYRAFA